MLLYVRRRKIRAKTHHLGKFFIHLQCAKTSIAQMVCYMQFCIWLLLFMRFYLKKLWFEVQFSAKSRF